MRSVAVRKNKAYLGGYIDEEIKRRFSEVSMEETKGNNTALLEEVCKDAIAFMESQKQGGQNAA